MNRLRLSGRPGVMACEVTGIPVFPGATFTLAYPEAIGDVAKPSWYGQIKPIWEDGGSGVWISRGVLENELTYEIRMVPDVDSVTSEFTLTNTSRRTWNQGMAFNCFQCAGENSIRDNECLRTWVRSGGEFKPLIQIPRVFSSRPALQLYSVEGAPPGAEIPFVAGFNATPDVVIEPWMAIVSRDGKHLVATVSSPGLFLFQNREYSCIHCATGFGAMAPGETRHALNKVYFVKGTLEAWHQRMRADLDDMATRQAPASPSSEGDASEGGMA